jgi:hypothetical protein
MVDKTDSCWNWRGATSGSLGYGVFYMDKKNTYSHRISYELLVGKIPDELCVLHKCDNPKCVNPEHLFLGTRSDNNKDRARKGRSRDQRGEKNNIARLKEKEVFEIKRLYSYGFITQRLLAKMFRVSFSNINDIVNEKRWAYLGEAL